MKSRLKKSIMLALLAVIWVSSFAGIKETFEDLIHGPKVTLDAAQYQVRESAGTNGSTEYTINGKKFSSQRSSKKSISGGAMTYEVPSDFDAVEGPAGNIAGYRYALNEIPSQFRTNAEDLFVFYFDNEKYLLDLNDKNQREAIEMAIIKNILPGEKIDTLLQRMEFPTKTITAKYKPVSGGTIKKTYDYFTTSFVDASKKTHNVEFVFTPNEQDGIGCILYVFTESNHKEDILYLMRTIEFK